MNFISFRNDWLNFYSRKCFSNLVLYRTSLWKSMACKHIIKFLWLMAILSISVFRSKLLRAIYRQFSYFKGFLIFKLSFLGRWNIALIWLILMNVKWILLCNLRISIIIEFLDWLKVMLKLAYSLSRFFDHFLCLKCHHIWILFKIR